jgi:hypothetical protein
MQAKDQQAEHARVHQSKQELAAMQQTLEQQQGTILELQKTLTTERENSEAFATRAQAEITLLQRREDDLQIRDAQQQQQQVPI